MLKEHAGVGSFESRKAVTPSGLDSSFPTVCGE